MGVILWIVLTTWMRVVRAFSDCPVGYLASSHRKKVKYVSILSGERSSKNQYRSNNNNNTCMRINEAITNREIVDLKQASKQ